MLDVRELSSVRRSVCATMHGFGAKGTYDRAPHQTSREQAAPDDIFSSFSKIYGSSA